MAALTHWSRDEIEWRTPLAVCLQMLHAESVWNGADTIWPEQIEARAAEIAHAVRARKIRR